MLGRLLEDILGTRISLGAISSSETRVSDALKDAVDEAWTEVGDAPVRCSRSARSSRLHSCAVWRRRLPDSRFV
jgi:hypothetical protein